MKMEGVLHVSPIPNSFGAVWSTTKALGMGIDARLAAEDWTIVDFDNVLRGNPHVQPIEKE